MQILYATDGSQGALEGARFLATFLLQPDSQVQILTVFAPQDEQKREDALDATREVLGPALDRITTETRQGSATGPIVEQILEAAQDMPADLLVVGTRGLSAIARFLLGSVAEGVARHAPCPVLLARPLHGALERVMVGVDSSPNARHAAQWLLTLPLPPGCEIRLVRVVPLPAFVAPVQETLGPPVPEHLAAAVQQEQDEARKALDTIAASLGSANGGFKIVTEVVMGHAAVSLIELARDRGVDLLVVGSQGFSGVEQFLLGSVSENVLRHAPCSVLVVKEARSR